MHQEFPSRGRFHIRDALLNEWMPSRRRVLRTKISTLNDSEGGARYMRFWGIRGDVSLAMAGYNAGEGGA